MEKMKWNSREQLINGLWDRLANSAFRPMPYRLFIVAALTDLISIELQGDSDE